jgi:LysM repeat protein
MGGLRMVRQYTAPAAALLAVTAAVLAFHYGVQQRRTTPPATTVAHTAPAKPRRKHVQVFARTYVVQRGDSFSSIAVKVRSTVAELERLNPGVSSTALRVGERLKVK